MSDPGSSDKARRKACFSAISKIVVRFFPSIFFGMAVVSWPITPLLVLWPVAMAVDAGSESVTKELALKVLT